MQEPIASLNSSRTTAALPAGQINASLFFQIARFLVWGQEHRQVAAAYPDFARLLESAEMALAQVGALELQDGCSPVEKLASIATAGSQSFGSGCL